MNAGGVDWDLLADHLGGALDGAARDRVAQLIATDPQWAAAAARLSAALSAVTADLSTLPADTMPDDVAARLDRALRHPAGPVPPPRRPTGAPTDGSGPGRPSGRRSDAPVRPPAGDGPTGPGTGRRSSRRRRTRAWGGLAVALGTATVVLVGVQMFGPMSPPDHSPGEFEITLAEPESPLGPPLGTLGGPVLMATDTDYRSDRLPTGPGVPVPPAGSPRIAVEDQSTLGSATPEVPDHGLVAVPEALADLWAAPDRCLDRVAAGYAPRRVTVEAADFAWFDGQPAVLVWLVEPTGDRWLSVAGPACGSTGAGADERHRAPLR